MGCGIYPALLGNLHRLQLLSIQPQLFIILKPKNMPHHGNLFNSIRHIFIQLLHQYCVPQEAAFGYCQYPSSKAPTTCIESNYKRKDQSCLPLRCIFWCQCPTIRIAVLFCNLCVLDYSIDAEICLSSYPTIKSGRTYHTSPITSSPHNFTWSA